MTSRGDEAVRIQMQESDDSLVSDVNVSRSTARKMRDREKFVNLIIAILTASGILLIFFVNYKMFETYLGELMFAYIFSEALWSTKLTFTNYTDIVKELSKASSQSKFSLRNVMFRKIRRYLSNFTYRRLAGITRRDTSNLLIPPGILITVFMLKPLFVWYLVCFALSVISIVSVFNNQVLIVLRLHSYLGMSDDTAGATYIISALLFTFVMLSVGFAVFVTKDFTLLFNELGNYFEKHASFANTEFRDFVLSVKPQLEEKFAENVFFQNNPAFEKLTTLAFDYFDTLQNVTDPEAAASVNGIDVATFQDVCYENLNLESQLWQLNHTALFDLYNCYQGDIDFDLSSIISHATTGLAGFVTFLILIFDVGFRIIFFLTILFLFLSSKETALQSLVSSVRLKNGGAKKTLSDEENLLLLFETELQKSMEGILLVPFKMSLLNSFATLFTMAVFDVRGHYLCTALVFFFSMFPLVSPFLVLLPWLMFYCSAHAMPFHWAALIFTFNYFCHSTFSNWALMSLQHKTNHKAKPKDNADDSSDEGDDVDLTMYSGKTEYATSYSIFFGLITFGAKGILIGPFMFCLVTVLHRVYVTYHIMLSESEVYQQSPNPPSHLRKIPSIKSSENIKRLAGSMFKQFHVDENGDGNLFTHSVQSVSPTFRKKRKSEGMSRANSSSISTRKETFSTITSNLERIQKMRESDFISDEEVRKLKEKYI